MTTPRIDLSSFSRPEIPGLLLSLDAAHEAVLQWLDDEYGWSVTRDASDPAWRITRLIAAREVLLRRAVDDAVAQTTLAYATGEMLDHIGITYYARPRLPGERDDPYRHRLADAPELYAVGLSGPWYEQTARDVPGVADARATTPMPGRVTIYILADAAATGEDGNILYANGIPSDTLRAAVLAAVTAPDARQQTDIVTVTPCTRQRYSVSVTLTLYEGPDEKPVLAVARAALASLAARTAYLGGSLSRDLIAGACVDPTAVRSAAIVLSTVDSQGTATPVDAIPAADDRAPLIIPDVDSITLA